MPPSITFIYCYRITFSIFVYVVFNSMLGLLRMLSELSIFKSFNLLILQCCSLIFWLYCKGVDSLSISLYMPINKNFGFEIPRRQEWLVSEECPNVQQLKHNYDNQNEDTSSNKAMNNSNYSSQKYIFFFTFRYIDKKHMRAIKI